MRKHARRPDEENPEWTAEEVRRAPPLLHALPQDTAEAVRRYRGQRGPQRTPTKALVSLRVDRDIVAAYRASGPGWQTRANDALRAYIGKLSSARPVKATGRTRRLTRRREG